MDFVTATPSTEYVISPLCIVAMVNVICPTCRTVWGDARGCGIRVANESKRSNDADKQLSETHRSSPLAGAAEIVRSARSTPSARAKPGRAVTYPGRNGSRVARSARSDSSAISAIRLASAFVACANSRAGADMRAAR